MAVYSVTHPTSGKTIDIEGDTPPSEKQLDEIFAKVGGGSSGNIETNKYGQTQAAKTEDIKVGTPEHRKQMEAFINAEGGNKQTTAGKLARKIQHLSPVLSRYDVAGKLTGEMGLPEDQPMTLGDAVKEIPRLAEEGLYKMPINAGKSMVAGLGVLKDVLDPRTSLEDINTNKAKYAEWAAKPAVTGFMAPSKIGEAAGAGFEAGGEALDPLLGGQGYGPAVAGAIGNTMAVVGGGKAALGAAKGLGNLAKDAHSKAADLAVEKLAPASWEPAGTPTTKAAPALVDKTQARLNRIREKSPQVIDNRFRKTSEELTPAERMSADPEVRAGLEEKMQTGLDNVEQLAKEGVIHEHDARGQVVLDESGVPKPYEVGKGGVVGAVKPALQALDSVWNEVKQVLKTATNKDVKVPTQGVRGLEKYEGRLITPEELQAEISSLNEVLYKTKDGVLSLEDTAKRNELKRAVGGMNTLLDDAVASALEDGAPGTKELHKQWGGVRHFTDAVLNGAEKKLNGGLSPSVSDVPVHGGLAYKATGVATRLANKFFKNPDSAFDAMIRARRAQGNKTRTRVPVETGPDVPMTVDPSTGKLMSGTSRAGERTLLNEAPPAPALAPAPTRSLLNEAPPAPALAPEPTRQTLGNTGGGPSLQPDPMGGLDLKAEVAKVGGGKKGVADIAKQVGVPAAVLATWLLADEKKKKQLAMLPAFAGLVAYHGGSPKILTEGMRVPKGETGAFYTTNPRLAGIHAQAGKGIVHAADINIKNPYEVDYRGTDITRNNAEAAIRDAQALGHDGVIIKNFIDMPENFLDVAKRFGVAKKYMGDIIVAFKPEQISNIRLSSKKPQGGERLPEGITPVKAFGKYDLSVSLKDANGKLLVKKSGNPYGVKSHFEPDTGRFVIEEIEVPENLKGQKLGSYLRQQVIEQAKKRGAKGISSSQYGDTLDSRRMWETPEGKLRPGVVKSPYAVVDAKGGIMTNDHGPAYWMDF
jgi:hypothetical protein